MYQELRAGKLPLLPSSTAGFQKLLRDLMHPSAERRPSAQDVLASPLFMKPAAAASSGASKGFAPLQLQLSKR